MEEFLENVLMSVPYFFIITDKNGKIIKANRKAIEFLGEDYFNEGITDIEYYFNKIQLFSLNDIKINYHSTPIFKVLNNIYEYNELKCKYNNRYLNICSYPAKDEENLIGGIIKIEDITKAFTDTLKMEEQRTKFLSMSTEFKAKCDIIEILRNKEKEHLVHLKAIINNISEGIIVLDKYGEYSFSNKSTYDITGLAPIKLTNFNKVNKRFNIYDEHDEVFDFDSMYKKYILNNLPIKRIVLKYMLNNKIKYVEFNSNPIIKEKALISTIITIKDITEIKIHQIYSEEQTRFITEVVNNIDVPIVILNYPSETIKLVNQKFVDELNGILKADFTINEIQGKKLSDICDFKNTMFYDTYTNVLKDSKEYTFPNYNITDDDGQTRFIKIKIKPFKKNEKSISFVYFHGLDITDEINHNKELENINRMKTEFYTITSHELRTPLTIIYSSIQLAYDIYDKEITPNINTTLKRINQNCKRLLKLVNNILDLSKAEAGYLNVNLTEFDIVSLTESICDSVNIYAQSKNINLIFDTNEEEKLIILDKDKYEKILLNLLSNAIKFTMPNKTIYVTLMIGKDYFDLKVRDEGIGIPKDKIDYIFDRFTQVNSTLSRQVEGTGIGLSLVKKLVELLNGSINVTSSVDIGTEFVCNFKLMEMLNLESKNYEIKDENVQKKINVEFSDID